MTFPINRRRAALRLIGSGALVMFAASATWAMAAETAAAPDPATLADACTSCHGLGGRSSGAIPTIAGLDREALRSRLMAFHEQKADGALMNRIARGYSEAEIGALADYFSKVDRK